MMAAVVVVASSYGQGTVTFANTSTQLVRKQTSAVDTNLVSMPVGGGHVELLWAPVGTTDLNLFSAVLSTASANTSAAGVTDFHTAPGRFSAGTSTIPGLNAGGSYALIVRGWTGSALTWATFDQQVEAFGYSSIFTLGATGNPLTTPAGTPVALSTFTGLTLTYSPAPEPTSMALAGLGAATMLIFRRRK